MQEIALVHKIVKAKLHFAAWLFIIVHTKLCIKI